MKVVNGGGNKNLKNPSHKYRVEVDRRVIFRRKLIFGLAGAVVLILAAVASYYLLMRPVEEVSAEELVDEIVNMLNTDPPLNSTEKELLKSELLRAYEELKDEASDLDLEDEVDIYNWSVYIHFGLNKLFEKATGCNVIYDTFESSDEVWVALSTGTKYDVVVPSDYDVKSAYELGYLRQIDVSLLPNSQYLFEDFRYSGWDPEHKWNMPYMWGTTGIGWNSERIDEEDLLVDPETGEKGVHWEQLFPSVEGHPNPIGDAFLQKYGKPGYNKITMIPGSETIGYAMKYLGWSFNDWDNETRVDAARDLLIEQKKYLLKYADASEYITSLPGEMFWVSMVWSGDLFQVKSDFPSMNYTIPKEGTDLWCDCMAIPKNARHVNAAHAWMNWMTDPAVAAVNSLFIRYANPVEASLTLLPEWFANDKNFYPPREWWGTGADKRCEWWRSWTEEERIRIEEAWMEIITA